MGGGGKKRIFYTQLPFELLKFTRLVRIPAIWSGFL